MGSISPLLLWCIAETLFEIGFEYGDDGYHPESYYENLKKEERIVTEELNRRISNNQK